MLASDFSDARGTLCSTASSVLSVTLPADSPTSSPVMLVPSASVAVYARYRGSTVRSGSSTAASKFSRGHSRTVSRLGPISCPSAMLPTL